MDKKERLTLSNMATIYGCCGLLDMCTDQDLMSLSLEGQNKFLDWLGWTLTSNCLVRKTFITYVRPEQSGRECTPGALGDPCEDPHGVDWGLCDFELRDFGRIRRHAPTRDATMNAVKFCEQQPRYRLDGTPITDDREWDMRLATEAILQDLKRLVISGSIAVPGEFDGLNSLVKTGYVDPTGRRCTSMDSIIINWNGNPMGGGNGITWNGHAVANTFNFVDVLLAAFRHVIQDISYSPTLSAQTLGVGDIALVLPSFMARCLLDMYTCWTVCPASVNPLVFMETFEGRRYRDSLNGGLYGAGRIYLDGFEIPLIAYDWGLISGAALGDAYLLTGKVGTVRLLYGEMLDMRSVPNGYPEAGYTYTDGGRLLTWVERDHTCVQQIVEMRPRIVGMAPWAHVQFQDVQCAGPGLPKSPDPCESSFFPETSFTPVECPPA